MTSAHATTISPASDPPRMLWRSSARRNQTRKAETGGTRKPKPNSSVVDQTPMPCAKAGQHTRHTAAMQTARGNMRPSLVEAGKGVLTESAGGVIDRLEKQIPSAAARAKPSHDVARHSGRTGPEEHEAS